MHALPLRPQPRFAVRAMPEYGRFASVRPIGLERGKRNAVKGEQQVGSYGPNSVDTISRIGAARQRKTAMKNGRF